MGDLTSHHWANEDLFLAEGLRSEELWETVGHF